MHEHPALFKCWFLRSITISLFREKIQSPEVAHHGYVVDGLPCLDESVMTIKDQIEMIKNWKLNPDFVVNIKVY